ncbi:MAG: hypothetical protein J6Z22_03525 [Lachnospiraceae bacterium]|nr:hypothetical protein [Lachnospiraceae bacterium]
MASIFYYLIIMFVIAIIIVIASLIAYNKRLDKVAKGEARDTHSKIPEPGTTAGITYKTVLICLAIITVLSVSSVIGLVRSLNSNVSNLQSQLRDISMDISQLRYDLKQSSALVSDFSYEITGKDLEKKTATLKFYLGLKEYTEDTRVTLGLKNREVVLTMDTPGTFSGEITTDLFEAYDQLKVCVTEGNITKAENMDFYEYLFWDVLPMHHLECNFEAKESLGKTKCSGWYRLAFDAPEKIQKVTVKYLVDGKEVKSIDATKQAKDNTQIDLDDDFEIKSDLSLLIETETPEGYKIVHKMVIVYQASPDNEPEDYERIYDAGGNLVWANEKYN